MSSKQEIAALLASQGGQFSPIKKRAYLLPVGKDDKGKTRPAVPQFVYDIAEAVMAPGKVLKNPGLMIDPETGRTSDYAIGRSADLAGMMTLGAGAIPAEANSLRMGIKAYHGSPHDFDRFDMSKIGTGEGAQAYGHGLYFAEAEDVANQYKMNLARPDFTRTKGGAQISGDVSRILEDSYDDAMRQGVRGPSNSDAIFLAEQNLYRQRADALKAQDFDWFNKVSDQITELQRLKTDAPTSSGRMYEVNIDANPDDFLDWDKPLSEQPHIVQALAKSRSKYAREIASDPTILAPSRESYGVDIGPMTGQDIYKRLSYALDGKPGSPKSNAPMLKAGIPGIKYLDAGSRGAGDGSRNYVVFDDNLISIVKKYGVAALVSAGVLSQAQGEEMKAQGFN